jgi:hypothetical protein
MSLYFFDVQHDGEDVTRDHRGVELSNLDAARAQALKVWTGILLAQASGGADPRRWHVVIRDVHGTELARVPYPGEPDRQHLDREQAHRAAH